MWSMSAPGRLHLRWPGTDPGSRKPSQAEARLCSQAHVLSNSASNLLLHTQGQYTLLTEYRWGRLHLSSQDAQAQALDSSFETATRFLMNIVSQHS